MAMDILFKAGSFILLLGVLIFVHELGHFLAAKALGVKVLRFSIGFGPRFLGFKRGETEYWIAPIPLGGYVKMAGDDPSQEMAPEDKGRGFFEQRPWRRFVIAASGPVMNLLFPVIVYFGIALAQNGELTAGPVVGTVIPGSPAALADLRPGDRIMSITSPGESPEPIRYFADISDRVAPFPGVELSLEVMRGGQLLPPVKIVPAAKEEPKNPIENRVRGVVGISQRYPAAVVVPIRPGGAGPLEPFDLVVKAAGKPVVHLGDLSRILAESGCGAVDLAVLRERPIELPGASLSVYVPMNFEGVPMCDGDRPTFAPADPSISAVISHVTPGSAAAEAGLARGDAITKVNGAEIHSTDDLEVSTVDFKAGQSVALTLSGGRQIMVTPREEMRENPYTGESEPRPMLGVSFGGLSIVSSEPLVAEKMVLQVGPVAAAKDAFDETARVLRITVLGIARIIQGRISVKSMGGPIMLFDIAARAAEEGLESFLFKMALISVNLGLMNLLPIPVLDGGHIMTCMVEAVTRRSLSMRVREIANIVGLVLLALLMVLVFKNDIMRRLG